MGKKINALAEIAVVYSLIIIFPMLLYVFLDPVKFTPLGGMTFLIINDLFYAALILGLLRVTGRSFAGHGISIRNPGADIKVIAICFVPVCLLPQALDRYMDLIAGKIGGLTFILLALALQILALYVMFKVLERVKYEAKKVPVAALCVAPLLLLPAFAGITPGLSRFLYILTVTYIFVGPVEELVFRGYFQSRLNEVFDRPRKLFGISWGAGLLGATLLFGFLHVLGDGGVNPLLGRYHPDFFWGFIACFMGLLLGFVREKTGSIVAPAVLHSTVDMLEGILAQL